MTSDRMSEAIAAYEANEPKQAARLLTEIVKEDKTNDSAWYYLGLVQPSAEKRRQCFERALRINPQNELASQALEAMQSEQPSAQSTSPDNVTPMPSNTTVSSGDQSVNIGFLSAIPGAPESLSVDAITTQAQALAKAGIPALTQQHESATESLSTWWQLVLSVGLVSFVIGVVNVVASLIRALRFEASIDLFGIIFPPFILILLGCVGVGAACFLSYWYIKQNGGTGELLPHSADIVSIWIPISILLSLANLVEMIVLPLIDMFRGGSVTLERVLLNGFPTMSGGMLLFTLISAGLVVYAMFLIKNLLVKRHAVPDQTAWIGALITAVVVAFIFF
mgnify:CR=1 FL=1